MTATELNIMSLILTICDSSILFSLAFVSGIRTLQGRKREILNVWKLSVSCC